MRQFAPFLVTLEGACRRAACGPVNLLIEAMNKIKIFPLGLDALTVEFGNEIDENLNRYAASLANYLENNPFNGFIETVPAYASVSVFYDFYTVRKNFGEFATAFDAVKSFVETALGNLDETAEDFSRLIEIPVSFDKNDAPDLEFVAETNNLTVAEVIEIYTSQIYRVFMLGFLPGFAYMGKVDEKIAAPRRNSPRLNIPEGSVGIAGRQTGVYPLESPGGWQIIGRTNAQMFDINNSSSLLRVGDSVKFYVG